MIVHRSLTASLHAASPLRPSSSSSIPAAAPALTRAQFPASFGHLDAVVIVERLPELHHEVLKFDEKTFQDLIILCHFRHKMPIVHFIKLLMLHCKKLPTSSNRDRSVSGLTQSRC